LQHRISAGVIVEHNERILLVRHQRPGRYDFWVAPGGGVEGTEQLHEAAAREANEETGLLVEPAELLYIEELVQPELRQCKFWFRGHLRGGVMSASSPAATEHIVEAAWLSRAELAGKQVFPPVLTERYWADRLARTATPVHLGLRHMEFW